MLDERGQLAVLAAIGIDVYRLRGPDCAGADRSSLPATPPAGEARGASRPAELMVACPRGRRSDRRLLQLLRALGREEGAVAWFEADASGPAEGVPDAAAYLLVGSAAQACSARMPLTRQDSAAIAVIADPADSAWNAPAKRALWQTLKPLARRLRSRAG